MVMKYSVTCTEQEDLYVVYTRDGEAAPAMLYCPAKTFEQANAIAGKLNLENALRECALILDQSDLTADTNLVRLLEAATKVQHIVRYDMNAYKAQDRINDATNQAAGLAELAATA